MRTTRPISTARTLLHENPLGLRMRPNTARGLPLKTPIPGVANIIAVASGKGGVGKSTTAVNLAISFARIGKRAGLLDADIFGPSIPRMMNLKGLNADTDPNGRIEPLQNYGVRTMAIPFLLPPAHDGAIVWRGLMVMKAVTQLLRDVHWGALDVLVIDMPPGTGDTQLSVVQNVPLTGAVIVSTPQDVALEDAIKGIVMFEKVHIKILGIVQNMSYFVCPTCRTRTNVFGERDNLRQVAAKYNVPILADMPLNPEIVTTSDRGTPITIKDPESSLAQSYINMAKNLVEHLRTDDSIHV
ncbi:hypothetical protein SeMB42_g07801 [Synchytrium endobioticum]|uniref:Uncharacterized protein n=1 Tax=Synchytrium endobioticum TaxID=286115 RepID=A0A507D1X5_9FUNG|nr:hypothetical protein SeMB42_g07801 [Synchytrium endobioticum]TPX45472.1 hypothetical protein SeLEV6574_g03845 [Synchytrium endobioticum]